MTPQSGDGTAKAAGSGNRIDRKTDLKDGTPASGEPKIEVETNVEGGPAEGPALQRSLDECAEASNQSRRCPHSKQLMYRKLK